MSVLSLIPEDKRKDFDRKESLESVYSSGSRLNLLTKRKRLVGSGDMSSNQSVNQSANSRGDRYVTQRVLSAKTHRVKQLQNQLSDAHYHLQELSNENRMLKVMQKKQEIALSRYENSNAELPQVLNAHSEEMRIQLAKYKQLRQQYREASARLKEREMRLQQLSDEHDHLLALSRDRNLPEREKLQAQVAELTARCEQQNNTISMLQRKVSLEAKNFKYQLQLEINKHKDTRNDLDMAISNADKLSTIIEMKEKILSSVPSRRSPRRSSPRAPPALLPAPPAAPAPRPLTRTMRGLVNEPTTNLTTTNTTMLAKYCESSRNLSSALSHDDDTTSSTETRLRSYSRTSRTSSSRTTPNQTRKNSNENDEMIELAKTVQDGMADLSVFDEEIDFKNASPDEVQKKIESMKEDLLQKIKNNEEPPSRMSSAIRRCSTEETIEEVEEFNVGKEAERPKSRGIRSGGSVSFFGDVTVEETTNILAINNHGSGDEVEHKVGRENSTLERRLSGKPIDKYCKDIIQDIEKSNKVIDRHVKEFSSSRFESDKLVHHLETLDKINDYVNQANEIPEQALTELNNNFNALTTQVVDSIPVARKRSLPSRRPSVHKTESRGNLFGDASMSNQDLLDDLLGKK